MKTDNIIATRKQLIKACVETAKKLYGSAQSIQAMHLWVYDPTYLFVLDDVAGLRAELLQEFKAHLVRPLINAAIEIHSGKPEDSVNCGILIPDAVAYTYEYNRAGGPKATAATIVKLELVTVNKPVCKSFTLNSSGKPQYRIGQVVAAYDNEGRFRENDIVINEEHISRAQADLYFKGTKLYLRPTSTGYRPNGNPTRVHRSGKKEPENLCDEFRGYLLQDGDIIELGGRNGVLYKVIFE